MKFNLNKVLALTGSAAFALLVVFLFWWQWEIDVIGSDDKQEKKYASITGLECDNYDRRPMAVMLASDPEARPLSGISKADLVFEMPVTPNGITRMMAVFQCEEPFDSAQGKPGDIGSVRSARRDFITLAASFKAIFVHWGGEREALNDLNNGIIDNIDAMKYEGTVFYRKNSSPRPHNGFTSVKLLMDKAEDLGYALTDSFGGYSRNNGKIDRSLSNLVSKVSVGYQKPYDVTWTYDGANNVYRRVRGGEPEMDKSAGVQVEVGIVTLMHTRSKFLSVDYISVDTTGEGEAEFYQNGVKTGGTWKNINDDLRFYNAKPAPTPTPGRDVGAEASEEMKFIPGKMWVEIVTN